MALCRIISVQILNSINNVLVPIRYMSWWGEVPLGPTDDSFGIAEAFNRDKNAKRINIAGGSYRNKEEKPYVLKCVRAAEEKIKAKRMDKEYQPIIGQHEFRKATIELAFGKDSPTIKNGLVATTQTISGTGALRLGGDFINKFHKGNKTVFIPNPTWCNHMPLFKSCGLNVENYTYYDSKTIGFDFKGCIDNINKIPEKSVILLHPVAHNPTGFDPNQEQWIEISSAVKKRQLLPFFDMAYQGFASGDVDTDAFAVRQFLKDEHQILLAQSYSKIMGLCGERVGGLTITSDSKESVDKIMSQIKIAIRASYLNPPCNGSRIVTEVLTDKSLFKLWLQELKEMLNWIISIRKKLRDRLEKEEKSSKNWEHITKQVGMFCYTGMTPDQVAKITKEFSVYLTKDGRMAMTGVSLRNVNYLAQAIHAVTK